MGKEAKTKIRFPEATQEAFEVFADELSEHLPEAEVTFVDTPKMGDPYLVVKARDWLAGNRMLGAYSLIVDGGDTLCISADREAWVVE